MKIFYESDTGTLYQGHVLDVLRTMPEESVDCIITSPPYWGLRDYGEETRAIWDGDPNCEHKWEEKEIKWHSGTHAGEKQKTVRGAFHNNYSSINGFCQKCGAWYGQLGLEPTLELYHKHLLQITAELKRILKSTGIMFWNHGNSYGGSGQGSQTGYGDYKRKKVIGTMKQKPPSLKLVAKCLTYQNYRLIFKMIDDQGWIARNDIIWHKLNSMPSSVKDRFSNAYEPVFFLAKDNKTQYYYNTKTMKMADRKPSKLKEGIDWDWKEVGIYNNDTFNVRVGYSHTERFMEKASPSEIARKYGYDPEGICPVCGRTWKRHASPNAKDRKEGIKREFIPCVKRETKIPEDQGARYYRGKPKLKKVSYWKSIDYWFDLDAVRKPHKESTLIRNLYPHSGGGPYSVSRERQPGEFAKPTGKNPGDLWRIPTQPFPEVHFAKFPDRLIEPLIKVGCPRWICKKCGKARVRITDEEIECGRKNVRADARVRPDSFERPPSDWVAKPIKTIGWSECECNAEYEGGVVLDPFMGSGTVSKIAEKYNRRWIGIEISPKYCDMIVRMVKNTQRTLFDD